MDVRQHPVLLGILAGMGCICWFVLARISRGRTLREFVIAAITIPVLCDLVMVSLFGNSAIFEAVFQGNTDFAQLALDSPEQGWYALLEMFPGATFLVGLATLSGLLFYLTSANSGAMVVSTSPPPSLIRARTDQSGCAFSGQLSPQC